MTIDRAHLQSAALGPYRIYVKGRQKFTCSLTRCSGETEIMLFARCDGERHRRSVDVGTQYGSLVITFTMRCSSVQWDYLPCLPTTQLWSVPSRRGSEYSFYCPHLSARNEPISKSLEQTRLVLHDPVRKRASLFNVVLITFKNPSPELNIQRH